jgi:hypothetical protein
VVAEAQIVLGATAALHRFSTGHARQVPLPVPQGTMVRLIVCEIADLQRRIPTLESGIAGTIHFVTVVFPGAGQGWIPTPVMEAQ